MRRALPQLCALLRGGAAGRPPWLPALRGLCGAPDGSPAPAAEGSGAGGKVSAAGGPRDGGWVPGAGGTGWAVPVASRSRSETETAWDGGCRARPRRGAAYRGA